MCVLQVPNEARAQQLYNDALESARADMDREVMQLQSKAYGGSTAGQLQAATVGQAGAAGGAAAGQQPAPPAGDTPQTLPAEVLARITQLKVSACASAGSRLSRGRPAHPHITRACVRVCVSEAEGGGATPYGTVSMMGIRTGLAADATHTCGCVQGSPVAGLPVQ